MAAVLKSITKYLRWMDRRGGVHPLLLAIPLLLIAANFLAPLQWGFNVDETGTYWISKDGPLHAISRAFQWNTQAILYHAAVSMVAWGSPPWVEPLMRFFSLIGMLAAAYFLHRFAEERCGKGTGWLAVLLFLAVPSSAGAGMQARPYGWIAACVIASALLFWRWLDSGNPKTLLLYFTCMVAAAYLQLLMLIWWALHGAWIVLFRRDRLKQYLTFALPACLLLIPLYLQTRSLAAQSRNWQYSVRTWNDLLHSFIPVRLAVALIVLAVLARVVWPKRTSNQRHGGWLAFTAIWWIAPHFILFLAYSLLGTELFHPRYLMFTMPGMALTVVTLLGSLQPSMRAITVCVAVLTLLVPPTGLNAPPVDFRAVMDTVQELSIPDAPPLLAPSWFVEGRTLHPEETYAKQPYVWAYLEAYKPQNRVYHFARLFESPPSEDDLARVLDGDLRDAKRILLGPTAPAQPWMVRALERRGYQLREHRIGVVFLYECSRGLQ